MKRMVPIAAIAGLAIATPAAALPNAFWTFGWKAPGRGVPWSIGDATGGKAIGSQSALQAAAPPPAMPIAPERIAASGYGYGNRLLSYDFAGL